MLSAEILRELWEDYAEAAKNLSNRYLALLTLVSRMLSIISTTLFYWLYALVIFSTYAEHCSQPSTCCPKEVVHMQGTEFTLARFQ